MNKVLVADDEAVVTAFIESILAKDGYQVLKAGNGKEAVELAQRENPDVILMDIKMPVMSGIEACRNLKKDKRTKDIPILVITAVGASKAQAIESGLDDFITKPFDREEVLIRVRSMLRIKALTNELQRTVAYVNELERQRQRAP